jgi:hypothetical protein
MVGAGSPDPVAPRRSSDCGKYRPISVNLNGRGAMGGETPPLQGWRYCRGRVSRPRCATEIAPFHEKWIGPYANSRISYGPGRSSHFTKFDWAICQFPNIVGAGFPDPIAPRRSSHFMKNGSGHMPIRGYRMDRDDRPISPNLIGPYINSPIL